MLICILNVVSFACFLAWLLTFERLFQNMSLNLRCSPPIFSNFNPRVRRSMGCLRATTFFCTGLAFLHDHLALLLRRAILSLSLSPPILVTVCFCLGPTSLRSSLRWGSWMSSSDLLMASRVFLIARSECETGGYRLTPLHSVSDQVPR